MSLTTSDTFMNETRLLAMVINLNDHWALGLLNSFQDLLDALGSIEEVKAVLDEVSWVEMDFLLQQKGDARLLSDWAQYKEEQVYILAP